MSHHFDSAADRADGRINACDLYAFPAAPGSTALIVTVNPDAGRSSPTTFRPDALHEFVVANNGGTSEDIAFSVSFTEPDETGQQQVQVRRASGPAASRGTAGTLLGEGRTGTVFSLDLDGDGLAWAGLAADPFNGDGIALGKFLQALSQGRYTPEVFTVPSNTFAGRDVTAIALQLPDAALGGPRVALWGRISLTGHTPKRQVNRIGQAMLRPLFFNPPATEAELDALNAEAPATDRDAHGERVRRLAATVARLAGLPDPDVHAERVAAAFLPDVVGYRPGLPARFYPGDGNGRALGDDAFDVAVAVLAGSTLGSACVPRQATPAFPYLSAPQPADLPPWPTTFGPATISPMRLTRSPTTSTEQASVSCGFVWLVRCEYLPGRVIQASRRRMPLHRFGMLAARCRRTVGPLPIGRGVPQQQGSYRNFTKGDTMERPERGRGSKSGEPADTPAETPRSGPRRLIELSHQIHHGMVTYPGLPGPEISDYLPREASPARYGPGTEFHIGRIAMVANTGTYLDSPFHRFAGATDVAGLPLGSVADLDGVGIRIDAGRRAVDRDALASHEVRGRAVLVHTGWDRCWGTERYGSGSPFLTAAADWLVEQQAGLVGIDSVNIDDTSGPSRPVHTALLAAGIPIVEHLCGLDQLPPSGFRFHAAPPQVVGIGTFPVRAYAVLADG